MNIDEDIHHCLFAVVRLRTQHAALTAVKLGPPDALLPLIQNEEVWNSTPKARSLKRTKIPQIWLEVYTSTIETTRNGAPDLKHIEPILTKEEALEKGTEPSAERAKTESAPPSERHISQPSHTGWKTEVKVDSKGINSELVGDRGQASPADAGPKSQDPIIENAKHTDKQQVSPDVGRLDLFSTQSCPAESAALKQTPWTRSAREYPQHSTPSADPPTFPGQPGPSELTKPVMTLPQAQNPLASATGGHDRPLVLGRTKPTPGKSSQAQAVMDAGSENVAVNAELNRAIEENLQSNTKSAAPADTTNTQKTQKTEKKEKAPKQPKPSKGPAPSAPLSPALIDLRVGHILRAVAHPNADSLYVSTIDMGDPEGTEFTEKDEKTGKIVRTVCSGLNGLVPLEEMQDRKIIVVANLKPVNMRSIKSAAMVLAASPKPEEGADPHVHDRVVELVIPPAGSEAGDKVYFEGWEYGEGKGPEKQLNPKKKVWEALQPGFFTTDDLVVAFDASKSEMASEGKGDLIVEGKGKCTVKTLKGAVVR